MSASKNEMLILASRSKGSLREGAKRDGVSPATQVYANKVVRDSPPEVVEAVKQGIVRVSDAKQISDAPWEDQREAVDRVWKRRDRTAVSSLNVINNKRRSEETMPALPKNEYRVVVVDPPWPISAGYDRPVNLKVQAGPPYPTMTLEQIKNDIALPLADEAWVFLWTVRSFLFDAPAVLKAWGVEYCFPMVWHKPWGPQAMNRPQSNAEYILVGRQGKPKFRDTEDFRMAFNAPREKAHSTKPDKFYETIKRVTVGPRLDMFSRRPIDGFDAWGKEAKQ